MTDPTKPRLTLDLDEIERQIRQSSQAVPPPRSNDPLAELARIVGQDDPFKSLLAPQSPPVRQPDADDMFQAEPGRGRMQPQAYDPDPPYPDPGYPEPGFSRAEPRFDDDPMAGRHEPVRAEPRFDASFEQFLAEENQRGGGRAGAFPPPPPALDDRLPSVSDFDPPPLPTMSSSFDLDEEEARAAEEPAPRSRKGLVVVGAVLGVAVVGVAGALMLGGGDLGRTSGEPPVVKADAGPTKVAPASPGGLEIPNQNKQIYEGTGAEKKTAIVNREEQPIDVRQAARVVTAPPGQAGINPNPTAPPPAIAGLGEPRRVRTVTVRPDGTIAGDEPPAPAPAPTRVASVPPVPVAVPPAPAPVAPAPVPAATASAPVAPVTPAAPASAMRLPDPAPAAAPVPPPAVTPAAAPAGPTVTAPAVPPPRPRDVRQSPNADATVTASAPEKQQQRLASVAPAAPAPAPVPAAPATPAASASTPGGGFAVQLAVRPSEQEAREAFQQFTRRYSEINGLSPIIRRAEVNGATVYRVRVGPMGREDAVNLCERLKASGGQCFVARN